MDLNCLAWLLQMGFAGLGKCHTVVLEASSAVDLDSPIGSESMRSSFCALINLY